MGNRLMLIQTHSTGDESEAYELPDKVSTAHLSAF